MFLLASCAAIGGDDSVTVHGTAGGDRIASYQLDIECGGSTVGSVGGGDFELPTGSTDCLAKLVSFTTTEGHTYRPQTPFQSWYPPETAVYAAGERRAEVDLVAQLPPLLTAAASVEYRVRQVSQSDDIDIPIGATCGDGTCDMPAESCHSCQSDCDECPLGPVYYIGLGGTDRSDCAGGTRDDPWASWQGQLDAGCIQPGDTGYLLAGTYTSSDGVFDGRRIRFAGTEGSPMTLAADPATPGQVRLRGFFTIDDEWGVIRGIEFDGDGGSPMHISADHIVLVGNDIHGRAADVDFSVDQGSTYDCVKIYSTSSGSKQAEDIQLIDNEISDCPEDCIDVTGARDLVYRGNTIHYCSRMQVKGGTENILIEQNRIYNLKFGILGSGMSCSGYCGSPVIPTLPVADRFVAKNVTIRNNVITDIAGSYAIGPRGWVGVRIDHNTLVSMAKRAVYVGFGGFDFHDDGSDSDSHARAYCEDPATSGDCSSCGADCWRIEFPSRDVLFRQNIVHTLGDEALRAEREAVEGLDCQSNIYYQPGGSVTFELRGGGQADAVFSLADFPYEQGSWEQDPDLLPAEDYRLSSSSVAIDRGTDIGVGVDFSGGQRDSAPDIGAHEWAP